MLEAFRDLTYPLGVGSYDAYAVPRRGYITKMSARRSRQLLGDIETVVEFARSHRIEREPMQSLSRDVLKRAAPECRYVVIDDKGGVVLAGTVALDDGVMFQINLNGKLPTGDYTIMALIVVNGNAANAAIRRIPGANRPRWIGRTPGSAHQTLNRLEMWWARELCNGTTRLPAGPRNSSDHRSPSVYPLRHGRKLRLVAERLCADCFKARRRPVRRRLPGGEG